MPNYGLVINSSFKPFSYQELAAPLIQATQAHQQLEDMYGELDAKASIWDGLANEQRDPKAYARYKSYADALRYNANELASSGLNPNSRRKLLQMRSQYSKDIQPIETAYKKREALAEEQRKLYAQNPTLFFQRDMNSVSLDELIDNPSMDYGKSYSGQMLMQQAGQIAAQLKGVLTNEGALQSNGLPFQYKKLIQYGYTPEQIVQAVTNPQQGNPVLTQIVKDVIQSSGMQSWATPEQLTQAIGWANQGLYNAIGKTDIQNLTDNYGMQNALAAASEARAAARQAAADRQAALTQIGDLPIINPQNIVATNATANDQKLYKNAQDFFNSYVYKTKDNKYALSQRGIDTINNSIKDYIKCVEYKGKQRYIMVTTTGKVFYSNDDSDKEYKDMLSNLYHNPKHFKAMPYSITYDMGGTHVFNYNALKTGQILGLASDYTYAPYSNASLNYYGNKNIQDVLKVLGNFGVDLSKSGAKSINTTIATSLHNIYGNGKQGDVVLDTEYNFPIPTEEQDNYTTQLYQQFTNTPAYEAVYDAATKKWKAGKHIDKDDIPITGDGKYKITSIMPSQAGLTVILQGGDGGTDIKRIIMPKYNQKKQDAAYQVAQEMEVLSGIVNNGRMPTINDKGEFNRDINGIITYTGTPLTQEQILQFYQQYQSKQREIANKIYGIVPNVKINPYEITPQ